MLQETSLRDFNHHVAKYVQQVEKGDSVIITRYGKPVAELNPYQGKKVISEKKQKAFERTLKIFAKAKVPKDFVFNRDEIYDR